MFVLLNYCSLLLVNQLNKGVTFKNHSESDIRSLLFCLGVQILYFADSKHLYIFKYSFHTAFH